AREAAACHAPPATPHAEAGCPPGRSGRPRDNPPPANTRRSGAAPPHRAAPRGRSPGTLPEDHEHGELLVSDESMVRAGGNECRLPLAELNTLAVDVECPGALEHNVDLVVGVRLLPVGLGC